MVDPELVAIGAEAPARLTDLGVMPKPGGEGGSQPDAGTQARVDVAVATPDFGGLRAASSQPAGNLESII